MTSSDSKPAHPSALDGAALPDGGEADGGEAGGGQADGGQAGSQDDAGLDDEVERLCASGDLIKAARLLVDAEQHLRASRLLERACAFDVAAASAAEAGELGEAVRLGVLSGDADLVKILSDRLVAESSKDAVRRVAETLAARGEHAHAAPLLDAIGDLADAAEAYARGGSATLAAGAYDRDGQPAPAARILEAAIRSGAESDADGLRAQLGDLYARHGKHRAAVRVLQRIDETSTHRPRAVVALAGALEALGLAQARRDLEDELVRHRAAGIAAPTPSRPDEGAAAMLYGRYRVVREVATTPHARLLEAVDTLTQERIALKVLASQTRGTGRDALQRFVREARALQQLRHPNVVPLRGYVEEGPAMVLAWMGGGSLRDLIDREVVTPARAAEVTRAVLDALGEAHRLGILHRDIKPSNLLFDDGGAARLADFGAAHVAESNATVTVGAIGTVAYMSPEQRAGHQATVQSDLYGVGVLLYEMLSGELPGLARPVSMAAFHPDLNATHDAVVNQLLADAPEDRFESAREAKRAIENATWASRLGPRRAPRKPSERPVAPTDDTRLAPPMGGGDAHDIWLRRDVHILPMAEHLERAKALARADHPALPSVLRADSETQSVWVEVARGRPLSQGLTLTPGQRAELEMALLALHRAGGAHGAVDVRHVYVLGAHARLAYPVAAPDGASGEADLAGLARLP